MSTETSKAVDVVQAGLITNKTNVDRVGAGGVFTVTCLGPDGQVKWVDEFHNLVVNVGLQDMNTQYFTGSSYSATWYLGLITGPGSGTVYAASDTLTSHAGWSENTSYSGGVRPACVFGTATTADPSVINNSGSVATFSINATATIAGAFLTNVSSGTSGILFSEGDFTGGDKSVASGDTLNVTYSFSLDAA